MDYAIKKENLYWTRGIDPGTLVDLTAAGSPEFVLDREKKTKSKDKQQKHKCVSYHPEAACWFKVKEEDRLNIRFIKPVNNSVIDVELKETQQKTNSDTINKG